MTSGPIQAARNGKADPRLVNLALAGYILLELAVFIYFCIWISRGY